MKKIQNRTMIKKINLFMLILTLSFGLFYIVFIYKTVVLASNMEVNNKKNEILSFDINQKEFAYIENLSSLDMDKAASLGYLKNTEAKIAYFNIKDNNELAVR